MAARRRSIAVVRPYAPNLAELAPYGALTDDCDVAFYYTGPPEAAVRADLDALGLQAIAVRRYRGYTDFVRQPLVQRVLDFKIGLGSTMLSRVDEVLAHDVVCLVDPIYAFADQLVRRLSPSQRLVLVRWELIAERYQQIWLARGRAGRVLARADAIACTSQAALDALLAESGATPPRGTTSVVYPGIALPAEAPAPVRGAVPTVACVARLQWQKGVDDLVAAIAVLRHARGRDVRLSLIGSGNLAAWRAFAARLGVGDLVDVVGPLPNAEVRRRLAQADAYCQPSVVSRTWCEQFGFAVVEAMALGRPVVACDTGVLREIVGDDGEYASARNASALGSAIVRVLDDPEAAARGRRLAARARERYAAATQGAQLRAVLLGGSA